MWHRQPPPAGDSSERGDTLVEIVITLVVVSITVVALIGALLTSISSSTEHRNLAEDDNVVKSALEAVVAQIEHPSNSSVFVECSGNDPRTIAGTYNSLLASFPLPTGYQSVKVTGVECWNPKLSPAAFDPNCSYTSAGDQTSDCTATGVTSGLQRITVTGTDPSNVTVSLSTLVRNPAFNRSYTQVY